MKKSIYYKGSEKNTERTFRVVIEVYAYPQPDLFEEEENVAEVTYLYDGSRRFFTSIEKLEDQFFISREITQEEHNYLILLSKLQTELWMNQFTGGFPRVEGCEYYAWHIYQDLNNVIAAQKKGPEEHDSIDIDCHPTFIPTGNLFMDLVSNIERVQGEEMANQFVLNFANNLSDSMKA